MPTSKPRIQLTVDAELAGALASVAGEGRSQAKLVRDLAIRGAAALQRERDQAAEAREVLLAIADGSVDIDFGAASQLHAERGDRLP